MLKRCFSFYSMNVIGVNRSREQFNSEGFVCIHIDVSKLKCNITKILFIQGESKATPICHINITTWAH